MKNESTNIRITGEELKVIRALRNLKSTDVAKAIDRYPAAITYVENGNRASLDEVQSQAVMKAFNIDVDLLNMIRRTIRLSKI